MIYLNYYPFSPIFTYLYPFLPTSSLRRGPRVWVKNYTASELAYWGRMLNQMTVGRVHLSNGPIDVPEDSEQTMQAPK